MVSVNISRTISGKVKIIYCVLSTIVFEEINKCDLIYNTYKAVNTLKVS